MKSALMNGIYTLVVFVSKIPLVRSAHLLDFRYVNNSCVNTFHEVFHINFIYTIEVVSTVNTYTVYCIFENKHLKVFLKFWIK